MRALIAVTAFASLTQAQAVESYTMQPHEIPLLPDYCQVKITGGTPSEQREWSTRFGKLWIDMHHFCHGIKHVNRAQPSRPRHDVSYNLERAIAEFDYIVRSKNAAGGHWFLSEVHMRKASVYRRMGKYKEASAETQRALAASRK